MSSSSIENEYATFHIEHGVMFFTYKPNIEITLEAAQKIVRDRLSLQGDAIFPVLCDIRGLKGANKAARDYLANEGSEKVKAVALVVGSPALKIMTDFYLIVNKPKVPTKLFTSREEALKYIETQV